LKELVVKKILMNMKMAKKLMLSAAVSLIFMLLLGIVAYSGLQVQKKSIDDIYNIRSKNYEICATEFNNVTHAHADLYKLISWTNAKYDDKKISVLSQEVKNQLSEAIAALTKLQGTPGTSADEKKLLQPLLSKLNDYNKNANDLIDMLQADMNAATMFMGSADDNYLVAHKSFDSLLALEKTLSSTQYATAVNSFRQTSLTVLAVLIVGLILSFCISMALKGIILAPVQKTVNIIESVSAGDFTLRIDIDSKDEVGQMAHNFDQMIGKLSGILREVAESSTQVMAAANKLNSTSEHIATGAREAAAQVGTVATASEEMAATSHEIALNCNLAAQKSDEANKSASLGVSVVEETVRGMEKIAIQVESSAGTVGTLGQKSNQIGEIIGTIEDIADQTNLLALNAAIEAARAGEQGRGFAVVADEVRALAERTTKATKEIGAMIKSIQLETKNAVGSMEEGVKEVADGSIRAAKSGQAIQDILNHISDVTMQVNQIATAAEEQTATTGEISNNILQITQVVSETARGAQESVATASQMLQLAETLKRLVGQFKLAA
jgi:methyl-accepting chemotaxis protein